MTVARSAVPAPRRAWVVTQTGLGRSPRAQLHALCLARAGVAVDLVGHDDGQVWPEVDAERGVRVHRFEPPTAHRAERHAGSLVRVAARVGSEALRFSGTLASLPRPDWVIVQTPPSVPVLGAAFAFGRAHRARVAIDWHNVGHALLAVSLGPQHPAVRFHAGCERAAYSRADLHLTVSDAMAGRLASSTARASSRSTVVLHDAPLSIAGPPPRDASEQRRELAAQLGLCTDEIAVPWVACPSSFGRDDALDWLIEAAETSEPPARAVVLATGEGPGRAPFERRVRALSGSGLRIATAYLPTLDYRRLLRVSDLGLSLHRSASGLDVPMKLAEMRGAGLPIAALDYGPALGEGLPSGALRFRDAAGLLAVLDAALEPGRLAELRDRAAADTAETFECAWRRRVPPALGIDVSRGG